MANRYRAFLSYSHANERIAARLHRKLEAFRLPRALRSDSAGGRLRPVFRDRDELASSASLGSTIETALDAADALVVVCSPMAAQSRWVNQEIRYFRSHHPDRPVLAFIVDGDPGQDPRETGNQAAMPLALLLSDPMDDDSDLAEPLAADARRSADGFARAFLKLVAGLLQVGYDTLRRRAARRRQRILALATTGSAVLVLVFAWLAWRATVARDEARAARAQAELELTSERQTRSFLLSVFQLADPGEARGQSITVREVLDSAVERIDSTQFARPVVKSRFLATLGQAYASLGLNRRSLELLEDSLSILPAEDRSLASLSQRIDNRIELADIHFGMGQYQQASDWLDQLAQDETWPEASPFQQARVATIAGDIETYRERDDAATEAYQRALALLDQASAELKQDISLRSRALGGLALVSYYAGDHEAAQRAYQAIVEMLLPVLGERHPDTIWARISLGSAAYAAGSPAAARVAWQQALATAVQVLGEHHPEVGTIQNNLGRLLLEEGDAAGSEPLLRAALAIDRAQRGEQFDDLAYPLVSLALSRLAQGDPAEAESLLLEATEIVLQSEHPMRGVVLTNRADLACLAGNATAGLALAREGRAANVAVYGEEDWHTKRSVMAEQYCSAKLGFQLNESAIADAMRTIQEKWPQDNVYRLRLSDHLQALRPPGG